jgi:hypothetical protein
MGKIYGILAGICKAACQTGASAFVAMVFAIGNFAGVFDRPL